MRNKISISNGIVNLAICNDRLQAVIGQLADHEILDQANITINVTNLDDIGLEITTRYLDPDLDLTKHVTKLYGPRLCYLKINQQTVINRQMHELVADQIIIRSYKTFHQNDDHIRFQIHHYFTQLSMTGHRHLLAIGGECYLYPFLIKPLDYVMYTDSPDIYQACQDNHPTKNSYLVDYHHFTIPELPYDMAILNTSIKGLTKHLANLLIASNIPDIYVVSCSEKSFLKDMTILGQKYQLVDSRSFVSQSNYQVSCQVHHLSHLL